MSSPTNSAVLAPAVPREDADSANTVLELAPTFDAAGVAHTLRVARAVSPDAVAQVRAQWRAQVARELTNVGDKASSLVEVLSALGLCPQELGEIRVFVAAARRLAEALEAP